MDATSFQARFFVRPVIRLINLSAVVLVALSFLPHSAMGQLLESPDALKASASAPLLHGVTIADDYDIRSSDYLNLVLPALSHLKVTPSVRLVFTLEVDSGGQGATGSSYYSAVEQIKASTNSHTGGHPSVMGQPVDSSYMICFTRAQHAARWRDFVKNLGSVVDFWEVGNEINGNWTYNTGPDEAGDGLGCPDGWPGGVPSTTISDVGYKMTDAYNIVKAAGKPAALTLSFCPTDLPSSADPFTWVDTYVSSKLKKGMDYVLISYYPDATGCGYGLPQASDWVTWFQGIQQRFPNAKVGLGEWGYTSPMTDSDLKTTLQEGYSINPSASLKPGSWIGGVYYWEFGLTAIPEKGTNQLGTPSDWNDVNLDLQLQCASAHMVRHGTFFAHEFAPRQMSSHGFERQ
jgi:hypothetical protein